MNPQLESPAVRQVETNWLAVTIVVATGVIAALQVGKGAIALPALRAEFGLGLGGAGSIMSVFAFLGMIGGIPTGAIVARFGDRRLLSFGLAAVALGNFLGSMATSFPILLGTRVIEGLGFVMIVVAAPALLQRIVVIKDRDLVFGIWSIYMATGMATALLFGASLPSWRLLWAVNAVLPCVFIVLLLTLVREHAPKAAVQSWVAISRDALLTIRSRGPVLLASAFALYSLLYFALASFLPVLLSERMALPITTVGVLSAIVVAANIVGNLAASPLLGRGVSRWTLMAVATGTMTISGIAIFALSLPPALVLLLCIIFSAFGGLLPAAVFSSATLVAPRPSLGPMTVGLAMQGSNLGQVIGPLVVGRAVDIAGWPAAAIPVAVVGVLSLVVAAALRAAFR